MNFKFSPKSGIYSGKIRPRLWGVSVDKTAYFTEKKSFTKVVAVSKIYNKNAFAPLYKSHFIGRGTRDSSSRHSNDFLIIILFIFSDFVLAHKTR